MKIARSISRCFIVIFILSNSFFCVKPAFAQLTIGSDGLWIKKETLFSVNGLEFEPAAKINLAETEVQRSATPITFYGSPSINQVYTFSTPITFAGVVRLHYKPSALDGAAAGDLKLIYKGSDDSSLKLMVEADVNTKDRYVASEFGDPVTFQLLTATAFGITPPELSDVALALDAPLQVGNTLTASYTFTDANPDDEDHSTVVWYRYDAPSGDVGKTAIPDATGKSYTLVAADIGKFISFEVTAHDGTVAGPTVESNRQGAVHEQGIRYVKPGATGNGYSWADASGDLQAMINASSAGDEVWVAVGEYQRGSGQSFSMEEGVKIYGGFPATDNPTMDERDWEEYETVLKGNGNSVVRNNRNALTAAAVLDGFTLTGGSAADGGGMYNNQASPTLTNVAITHNTVSHYGGGMYNTNSSPVLIHVIIADNTAEAHGGGVYQTGASSKLTMEHVTVSNNTAAYDGGGINSGSDTEMTDVTITGNKGRSGGGVQQTGSNSTLTLKRVIVNNNTATAHGGGINKTGSGQFTLEHVTVSNNTAGYDGGGINSGSDTEMTDVTITGNKGRSGGGVQQTGSNSTFTVERATVSDNIATAHGGGINKTGGGQFTLAHVTVSDNTADYDGGGINSSVDTEMTDVTITGNKGRTGGGIQQTSSSPLTMVRAIINNNTASQHGGGISSGNDLTLTEVEISGNVANQHGGGIYKLGTGSSLLMTGVTVSGNTASWDGGGIHASSGGNLTNVTITGNKGRDGGGISGTGSIELALTNGTISGNTAAGHGGGVYQTSGASATLTNSIVWNNRAGSSTTSASAAVYSNGGIMEVFHSLIANSRNANGDWRAAIGTDGGGNIDADPLFVAGIDPADAPTADGDFHLQSISPAINTGDPQTNATDYPVQAGDKDAEGNTRMVGGRIDLGAYENQTPGDGVHIRYVKPGATGNGYSWSGASGDLQAMITASTPGDEVWVAAGEYQPASDESFSMKEGVKIYGGFPATGNPESDDRDWGTHATILKGNGNSVVHNDNNGLTATAVLDGFTVTGGSAAVGGGIYNQFVSPTFTNLIISGNTASANGGGMGNETSSPTLTNVLISGNKALNYGGIVFRDPADAVLTNVTITGNYADVSGGGIAIGKESTVTLTNSIIWNNQASGSTNSTDASVYKNGTLYFSNSLIANSRDGNGVWRAAIGTDNGGNIAADPLFVGGINPATAPSSEGDFTLQAGSPALNAGNPQTNEPGYAVQVGEQDLAAKARIVDDRIDMGAYERQTKSQRVEIAGLEDGELHVTYGQEDFIPEITISPAGRPVTLSLPVEDNEVASIVEGKIKIHAAGEVELTVIADGDTEYDAATVTVPLVIGKKAITVSLDTELVITKVYDGDRAATLTTDHYVPAGIVEGDVVTVSSTAIYNNKNIGDDKAITISDFELDGADAANYTVTTEAATITGSITARPLTVTLDDEPTIAKVYDGDNKIALAADNYKLSGIVDGEVLTISGVAVFDDPNAGDKKEVTVTDFELGGADAGNYEMVTESVKTEGSITPKALTVAADADQHKVYGSADPALTFEATGFEGDDDEHVFTGALIRAMGEDVDTYAITQGTLSAGGNYTIVYTGEEFSITPKGLTVAVDAGQSKVYGSDDPALRFEATGFAWDDDKTVFTGALSRDGGEDVGSYDITQGTLDAGDNYTIVYTGAGFSIIPKELTVKADAGQSKVYGSANPALTFTAIGFEWDDDVTVLTGTLARAAGENVDVYAITQGTLSAGDNYTMTYTGADFSITPKELIVMVDAGQSKVYGSDDRVISYTVAGWEFDDGKSLLAGTLSREAGEDAGTYTITQGTLDAGDNYSISYTEVDFTITPKTLTLVANAGQNKVYGSADPVLTYEATGFEFTDDEAILTGALSREAGEDAGTYTITGGDLSAGNNYAIAIAEEVFNISRAELTVTANADQGKVYGEDDPVLTFTVTGFERGDDENLLTGTLSREAGEDVDSYVIGQGTLDAGDNYTITYTGADFIITPKTLAVTADAGQGKVYGSADPILTYKVTGFERGDDKNLLTGTLSREAGEDADSYTITQGTLSAGGNYAIAYTGEDFSITPKTLTVKLSNTPEISKVYDGNRSAVLATANHVLEGGVDGDDLSVSGTAVYRDKDAGTDKEIVVSDFELAGSDANNYHIITTSATTTGVITAKPLTVALDDYPLITKVYDGNNAAVLAADNYVLTGMVDGDDVTVSGAAKYDDAEVGDEKVVTVAGFELGGTHAGNYVVDARSTATTTGRITVGPAGAMHTGFEVSPAQVGRMVTITITLWDMHGNPVSTVSPVAFSVSVSGANNISMDVTNNGDGTYSAAYTPENGGMDELSILLGGTAVSGSSYRYAVSDFPGAPLGLRAKAGNRQVLLEWEAPEETLPAVLDYMIEYSRDGGITWTVPNREPSPTTRALVIGLTNNRTYLFRVSAMNAVGQGPASGTVQGIPTEPVPDENGNLPEPEPGTPVVITDGKVEAVTLEVIDGEYLKLSGGGYVMELASLGVDGERIPISAIDAIIRLLRGAGAQVYVSGHGFEPGTVVTVYLFSNPELVGHLPVDADGSFGGSLPVPASLELGHHTLQANGIVAGGGGEHSVSIGLELVDRKPQWVEFTSPAEWTYGDGPVTLGATASSGLAVSYAVTDSDGNATGMASITDNNKLHIHGAGDIRITASQAGDVEYAAAEPMSRTLRIDRAPLAVSVADATRAYGEVNPAFGLTYEGFVNGDDAPALGTRPQAATEATATSAPGSYAISISGGQSADYAFSYEPAILTITKASQAITLDAPEEVDRGAGSITLDVSASSGLPVMLSIDDEQVATVNGSTLAIHRLGTVTITATQAGDGNYGAAEPVTVTIRVTDPSSDFPIRVHPAVSPNGDGINEFLMVEGIRDYPDNRVTIISRNGTVLWEASGYDNDRVAFRGISTGQQQLPAGTYFYIFEVKVNGKWEYEKGYFVIRY